jgi:signal peptidase I
VQTVAAMLATVTPQQPDDSAATSATAEHAGVGGSGVDSAARSRRARGTRRRAGGGGRSGSFWREVPVLVLIALGLALLIKAFLVQAFYIPSDSMMNTLQQQDRVLVNKLEYRFGGVERGEVVVFKGEDSWAPEVTVPEAGNPLERGARWVASALGLTQSGERDFIKRVIGEGGDTVACCDHGRVTVNGEPIVEPYIYENSPLRDAGCTSREFGPVTVPEGRLWVMGDHRSMSSDSRCHVEDRHQGTVAESSVIGHAFVVVWPVDRLQTLDSPTHFAAGAGPYLLGGAAVLPVGLRRARRRRP